MYVMMTQKEFESLPGKVSDISPGAQMEQSDAVRGSIKSEFMQVDYYYDASEQHFNFHVVKVPPELSGNPIQVMEEEIIKKIHEATHDQAAPRAKKSKKEGD